MKKSNFLRQFHWKIFLLRILVHALALSLTVLILPNIYFINFSILSLLLVTLVLGILNALVRPILEVLTIRLLFVSYGLILVLVNALILYLLAFIAPSRFVVDGLLWALVGGLTVGIFGNFLENLFGVTRPILPDEAKELRKQIEEQDVSMLEAWIQERKAARKLAQNEEQARMLLATEAISETVDVAEAGEQTATLPEPEATPEPAQSQEAEELPANEQALSAGGEA